MYSPIRSPGASDATASLTAGNRIIWPKVQITSVPTRNGGERGYSQLGLPSAGRPSCWVNWTRLPALVWMQA